MKKKYFRKQASINRRLVLMECRGYKQHPRLLNLHLQQNHGNCKNGSYSLCDGNQCNAPFNEQLLWLHVENGYAGSMHCNGEWLHLLPIQICLCCIQLYSDRSWQTCHKIGSTVMLFISVDQFV